MVKPVSEHVAVTGLALPTVRRVACLAWILAPKVDRKVCRKAVDRKAILRNSSKYKGVGLNPLCRVLERIELNLDLFWRC
jgi:hypothetical protein